MKSVMVLAEVVKETYLYAILPDHSKLIRCTRRLAEECGWKILSDVK